MNYFRNFASAIVFVFIVLSASAFADDGAKIACVDVAKVIGQSKTGQSAQKQLDDERKKVEDMLSQKKGEFDRQQQALEKQRATLSEKALSEKEEQLISLDKDLKRNLQDKRESFQRDKVRIQGDLFSKIRKVITEIGKERGFTVILERSGQGVLYAGNNVDITDDVIKRFDSAKD